MGFDRPADALLRHLLKARLRRIAAIIQGYGRSAGMRDTGGGGSRMTLPSLQTQLNLVAFPGD
jgi:hypothetical protein